jgi:tRNA threonylcarbamoyladenosine biosynthesis protein TsaE
MVEKLITRDDDQTREVGRLLASELQGGEVLSLLGDLGGGKTTFVQGIALGLGIEEKVISPTFVILKKYKASHLQIKWLYHLDLYRISSLEEIADLGFEEIISPKENIVVVEWAEKVKKLIPEERNLKIEFKFLGKNTREIILSVNGK